MKKSAQVTLTIVAAAGLVACSRRQDPCETAAFNEEACRQAIANQGYYWRGSWVPMHYSYPYFYYYDHYRSYVAGGGSVHATSHDVYSRPAGGSHSVSSGSSSSHSVERGGFGSTGSSHSSGS